MKFRLSISIICALLMSANQVLAISYQSDLNSASQKGLINSSQLSAAKLLENYLDDYKNKINSLHQTYQGTNNAAISNFNLQISKMSRNLNDIQDNRYNSADAGKIMSKIVLDLKTINTRMKVFLEQEKILYYDALNKKQKDLSKIGLQISNTLDNLLLSISNKLIQQNSLSTKQKKLVESLVVLREENNKMKAFQSISFESQDDMNEYIKGVIGAIRTEFRKIRSI